MQKVGSALVRPILGAAVAITAWLLLLSSPAAAAASCDRLAATDGSDSNPGTAAAPFRTAQRLADSLSPGQSGCLRSGTYTNGVRIATSDVTLTSYPGERATISGKTYVTKDGDRVTISFLNLVSGSGTGQFVNGTDDVFDNVDVTSNNTENCFIIGSDDPNYGRTEGLIIEHSRIHNCGQLNPDTNQDHGIYVAHADNTVIRDNWIYDNADRGVQLYPDARGTHVYGNVIDGNGEGVTISGDDGTASSDNVIENNVISNSKIRWNVESYWGGGVVGTNNVVRNNCLLASNGDSYYNHGGGIVPGADRGFTTFGNTTVSSDVVTSALQSVQHGDAIPCGSGSSVTLVPPKSGVSSGEPVSLHGHASSSVNTVVTIQVLHRRHWKKIASTRLRSHGSFKVRTRLHGRGRLRLRARVPRVGKSRPVALRVRR
jgi:hypothetical protein